MYYVFVLEFYSPSSSLIYIMYMFACVLDCGENVDRYNWTCTWLNGVYELRHHLRDITSQHSITQSSTCSF